MAEFRNIPQSGAQSGAVIDQGLRTYMQGIYNYMSLGIALTAIVVLALASNPAAMATVYSMKWVFFIAIMAFGFIGAIVRSGAL
jgi:uncharacterized protein